MPRQRGSYGHTRPKLPRFRAAPTTERGPRVLAPALRRAAQPGPFPPAPASWTGSLPEWAIYWAHLQRRLQPDLDFSYQGSFLGGRQAFGGLVVDFLEHDVPVAINVQGEYIHYDRFQQGPPQLQRDLDQRDQLAALGLQLVFVDAAAALQNPLYLLDDARKGIDHSQLQHGG